MVRPEIRDQSKRNTHAAVLRWRFRLFGIVGLIISPFVLIGILIYVLAPFPLPNSSNTNPNPDPER